MGSRQDQILKRQQVAQRGDSEHPRVPIKSKRCLKHPILPFDRKNHQVGTFEEVENIPLREEPEMGAIVKPSIAIGPALAEEQAGQGRIVSDIGRAANA